MSVSPDWVSDCGRITLYQGECLAVMAGMDPDSVDLIATDPPYFKVKGEAWDNQWDTPEKFIAWLGGLFERWRVLLKGNGSLYCFASPQMRARVEVEAGRWFNVLPSITWRKGSNGGRHMSASKESLRAFFPETEAVIFAEHYGADNIAKGEAGYQAKCDELRGFVFEPLRAYFDEERKRAGVRTAQIMEWFAANGHPKYVTARHTFSRSQWELPTKENYEHLRRCLSELNHSGEDLRRDYEDLRRDYEDLRRPFNVTADVPYTDVWDFPTVGHYPGKHPCEKPLAMMRHIITASSRADDVVFDPFMGSGTTGRAAALEGRRFIGVEINERYYEIAKRRIKEELEANLFAGATA